MGRRRPRSPVMKSQPRDSGVDVALRLESTSKKFLVDQKEAVSKGAKRGECRIGVFLYSQRQGLGVC